MGAALFALTAMMTLAACSDNNNNAPLVVDLSGSYAVTDFGIGPPASGKPATNPASGTGTITLTTYDITIDPPYSVASAGTLTAYDDGTFTEEANAAGGGLVCTGTWARTGAAGAGSVLSIDATCPLGNIRTVTDFLQN